MVIHLVFPQIADGQRAVPAGRQQVVGSGHILEVRHKVLMYVKEGDAVLGPCIPYLHGMNTVTTLWQARRSAAVGETTFETLLVHSVFKGWEAFLYGQDKGC